MWLSWWKEALRQSGYCPYTRPGWQGVTASHFPSPSPQLFFFSSSLACPVCFPHLLAFLCSLCSSWSLTSALRELHDIQLAAFARASSKTEQGWLAVRASALPCKATHAIDLLSANCCCWWHFTCSVSWGQASSFGNKRHQKAFHRVSDARAGAANSTLLCARAGCSHPPSSAYLSYRRHQTPRSSFSTPRAAPTLQTRPSCVLGPSRGSKSAPTAGTAAASAADRGNLCTTMTFLDGIRAWRQHGTQVCHSGAEWWWIQRRNTSKKLWEILNLAEPLPSTARKASSHPGSFQVESLLIALSTGDNGIGCGETSISTQQKGKSLKAVRATRERREPQLLLPRHTHGFKNKAISLLSWSSAPTTRIYFK